MKFVQGRLMVRRMRALLVVAASGMVTIVERATPTAEQPRVLGGLALFVSLAVALNYWWDRRTA